MKVSEMHCEGCNQSMQNSLSKIDGIRNVHAEFRNEEVQMELDENKVNLEKIRNVIRKIGFIPSFEQIDTGNFIQI